MKVRSGGEALVQAFDGRFLLEDICRRALFTEDMGAWVFSERFDPWRSKLFAAADAVRRTMVGDDVYLRGLIEFSNHCACRCDYCGISAHNPKVERYRMSHDEILDTMQAAYDMGFRSFVLQSGEDRLFTEKEVVRLLTMIKDRLPVAVTLSIGEWSRESLAAFRKAGADRYLLRIETSDPELFAKFHRDSTWDARHRCLMDLQELGYQVGSGILVGLPGQDGRTLARDLNYLLRLRPEMVGIGPFIPHPETPLADAPGGTLESCLTFLALLRLYLPDSFLPATTAMGSIDPKGRQRALEAGANVLMPNVSPTENRARYALYPNKICLNDDAQACRRCTERWVTSMGRKTNLGHGHIRRNVF